MLGVFYKVGVHPEFGMWNCTFDILMSGFGTKKGVDQSIDQNNESPNPSEVMFYYITDI